MEYLGVGKRAAQNSQEMPLPSALHSGIPTRNVRLF